MNPEQPKLTPFHVDTSKLSGEKGTLFAKAVIEQILGSMEKDKLKPFNEGDLVATLQGPYAHIGLMVIAKQEDGMTQVMPGPDAPLVTIPTAELFHFYDYHEAFKVALVEAQTLNPSQPQ